MNKKSGTKNSVYFFIRKYIFLYALMIIINSIAAASASQTENFIADKTHELLKNYRGKSSLRIAVVRGNDLDKKSNIVPAVIVNTVTKTVFDDGRFSIVERELLNKIIDEMTLQQTGMVEGSAINELGKLSGAQLVLIIKSDADNIDLRILSVESGEILAFASGMLPKDSSSNLERLKEKYLSMECPGQTKESRNVVIASFNAYPEDKREFYIMAMINSCESQIEQAKQNENLAKKKKELGLEGKTIDQLEKMFIEKDTQKYPSKAVRKMMVEKLNKAYMKDMPEKNPEMKTFYSDLYAEELMKYIEK